MGPTFDTYLTAYVEQESIVQLFRGFALAKTLAERSQVVYRCDMLVNPWKATSADVVENINGSAELDELLKAEVAVALERLKQRAHSPNDICDFMKDLAQARQGFFRSYQMKLDATGKINQDAAFWLTFGLRAASVARASADVALAWAGLLCGPAVFGLDMAKRRFIIFATEEGAVITKAFIFKKFGVALTDAFGTTLAENWQAAARSDMMLIGKNNMATNTPGLLNDLFTMIVQFFHNRTISRLQSALTDQRAELTKIRGQISAAKAANTPYGGLNAARRAAEQGVKSAQQSVAAQQGVPNSLKVTSAGAVLKAAAWGLTMLSTEQSLARLYRNWNGGL